MSDSNSQKSKSGGDWETVSDKSKSTKSEKGRRPNDFLLQIREEIIKHPVYTYDMWHKKTWKKQNYSDTS